MKVLQEAHKSRGVVLRLAVADLGHEWILTLCLVMATAAVIAPLLTLMGLKYGTIATLRDRLVQDPVYREIRPAATRVRRQAWFQEYQTRREVAFLIPTILPASSIIQALPSKRPRSHVIDLIPTAAGDPLILENGGTIPGPGQCVLTTTAAQRLEVKEGDVLETRATRIRGGRREFGKAMLEVVSVLRPSAGGLERMYAPLSFVLDVENYKEGMAAPAQGWKGETPRPYVSFDGIIVLVPDALTPVQRSGLAINTGITVVEALDGARFRHLTGVKLPEAHYAYDLKAMQGTVTLVSYNALKQGKLRGRGAVLLPYVKPTQLTLAGQTTKHVMVTGLSLSAQALRRLGLPRLPWGQLTPDATYDKLGQVLLPDGMDGQRTHRVTAGGIDGPISFPLRNRGTTFADYGLIPIELLGILRTGQERKIRFNEDTKHFVLERIGFRGFRMYARNIDDVVPLSRELEAQGIGVIARVEEIERIRILDRGLTRIFWLVAVVGISGGIAVLIASLYAAVQRKKRELGIMRLLGLTRLDIFRFPVYQGLTVAMYGVGAAILVFLGLASVINHAFADDLDVGQEICYLPGGYVTAAFVATICTAFVSSLFAAWKTTQIDPAEAMREE